MWLLRFAVTNGWDVAEAFRVRCPQLPVIYASANPRDQERMVTGSAFFEKPSRMTDLLATGDRLWSAQGQSGPAC